MNQEILSLRRDAPELYPILIEGTLLRYGESWAALPREVVLNSTGVESIVFEVIRPEGLTKPSFVKMWFKAIRPESLTITFTPSIAVLLYGIFKGWETSWLTGGFALLGVVFFQISVNLLSDVEDHLRLLDLPGSLGGSGVIQKGWLSAKKLRKFGYIALGVGVLLGLPSVLRSPQILLLVGGMGAVGVLGYSSRPLEMKYRALGDFSIFLLVGPLLCLGISEATFGRFDFSVLLLGLFFGFVSWGISHSNNLQDIEDDMSHGINTLASWIGFRNSRHLFAALYTLAFLSLSFGVFLGALPQHLGLVVVFGALPIFRLTRRVYKAAGPASALLGPVRFNATKIHFFLGTMTCVGLLVASLLYRKG